MTAWFAELLASWSSYYGDHTAVSGTLRYLHLAGVMIGGGTALATDRLALTAGTSATRRARVLAALGDAHRVVLPCLACVGLTGLLMFLADAATFLASSTFVVKMLTVATLAVNGAGLRHAEGTIRRTGAERSWALLRAAAGASTVLWLTVLLLGVLLTFGA
jgi:hypothetical protein